MVGYSLTPSRSGDRRWSVSKESGLPVGGGVLWVGEAQSAKKGGAQWGHCERQTEWSRKPAAITIITEN